MADRRKARSKRPTSSRRSKGGGKARAGSAPKGKGKAAGKARAGGDVPASSSKEDVTDAEQTGDVHRRAAFKPWMQMLFFMADAWLAHIGWDMMYGFLWALLWHQVDPTDSGLPVIFSILFFLGLMAVPWLLESKRVLRAVDQNIDYATLVLPTCFLLALVPVAPMRTAIMAVGAVTQFTHIGILWSKPSTDFRAQSFRYAMPLGLLFLLIVRWNQASINPLFNADQLGVAALIGVTGYAGCAIIITASRLKYMNNQSVVYHTNPDLDYDTVSEDENKWCKMPLKPWWLFVGVSYASFLFIVMWLFTSTAAVSRWAGLNPFPYGLIIIGALTVGVGVYFFTERYVNSISENGLEMEPPLTLILSVAALVNVGCGLMVHGESAPAVMCGGALVAALIPLTFYLVLKDFAFLRPHRSVGRAIAAGAFLFFVYGFMQLGVLVGGEGTIFGDFHNKPAAALWLMSIGTFVGPVAMWVRRRKGWEAWHAYPEGIPRVVPFRVVLPTLAICLVVFLLPWLVIRPQTWGQDAPGSTASLRIASINVLRGYRDNGAINVDRVLAAVDNGGWDLVALQESDALGPAYGNRDLVGYWTYYLNMHEYYGLNPRGQTFGCAYLSHHHMTEEATRVLFSKTDCTDCPPPNRVLLRARVTINGTAVTVYNTQLEDLLRDATVRQAAEVASIIADDIASNRTDAMVLLGDFQLQPTDPALDPIFALPGVRHVTELTGAGCTRATCDFPATETVNGESTDHIYVRGLNVNASGVYTRGDSISDHLPIWAELTVA